MTKNIRTWVIVADSGRAQLLIPDEDETQLLPADLPGLSAVDVSRHARDVKSDRPGRSFSSERGGVRHAIEPRHDYHKQEKHKFAAAMADAINRACLAQDYDRLVLVVPPRTLGELRSLLSDRVQAHMSVIPKDLTKATTSTIWLEVADAVRHPPLTRTT
jgi:protein required for attachment to host cells